MSHVAAPAVADLEDSLLKNGVSQYILHYRPNWASRQGVLIARDGLKPAEVENIRTRQLYAVPI